MSTYLTPKLSRCSGPRVNLEMVGQGVAAAREQTLDSGVHSWTVQHCPHLLLLWGPGSAGAFPEPDLNLAKS